MILVGVLILVILIILASCVKVVPQATALVMERLGGGGHMNSAGAQLTGCTLEDAKRTIENTLDEMIREGDIK